MKGLSASASLKNTRIAAKWACYHRQHTDGVPAIGETTELPGLIPRRRLQRPRLRIGPARAISSPIS